MHGGRETMDRASGLLLAEQLATRLCHDLSGPLSGLIAALDEGGAETGALPLAAEAATALRQRLALLRAAWGAPAALPAEALRPLLAGLPRASRLRVALSGPVAGAMLTPLRARLLLNALMLAADSLPRGGEVFLEGDPREALVLGIDGSGAAWPADLAVMLTDAQAAWDCLSAGARGARQQAAVLALMSEDAGARARILLGSAAEPAAPLMLDLSGVVG